MNEQKPLLQQNLLPQQNPVLQQNPSPQYLLPTVYVKEAAGWEYHLLVHNLAKEGPPDAGALNELGKDGWELAAVFTDSPFVYFYFKRQSL
ncbi:MAG: hypothetical protein L0332_12425 [Chloroflexi bacterium]|nr:hypothetical protein [Chloroflexota bacterium]MCI0574889.1 hypothetical protein [Chloroflexota bacterium]MCI0648391.1 hypothetical protein [Chloroflexota bacterium]MCI0727512.1 hypothetical protein [Chloroflexota bacterium]